MLWPRVVELLEHIREGDSTVAEWVEQNRRRLGVFAGTCGIVGLLVLIYAGLDGYAYIARYIARAQPIHWYVTTVTQIAAEYLFHSVVLFGVYCIIRWAVDRRKPLWPLLQHGDKIIYAYIVFAVVANIMPFWQTMAQRYEYSTEWQFDAALWASLFAALTYAMVTSLPLVAWGMFAPVLKSGVGMMEGKRLTMSREP
ncbi:MAG TPA: hypothetical protein VLH60_07120 [Sedimentisphaerales bacterium]|nr:hypothetical protein [Sedimentisphaerales bacterium]